MVSILANLDYLSFRAEFWLRRVCSVSHSWGRRNQDRLVAAWAAALVVAIFAGAVSRLHRTVPGASVVVYDVLADVTVAAPDAWQYQSNAAVGAHAVVDNSNRHQPPAGGPRGAAIPISPGREFEADYDVLSVEQNLPTDRQRTDPTPAAPRFRYLNVSNSTWPARLLSESPRVYLVPDFLSPAECDQLVDEALPQLRRSQVEVRDSKKENHVTEIRTSRQAWLPSQHGAAAPIVDRILELVGFGRDAPEALQLLRYQIGQRYHAHFDYFDPAAYGPRSENRAVTIFLYLNDVPAGGETVFPHAGRTFNPARVTDFSACNSGLRVRPRRGAAAVFYDMKPSGKLDPSSLHGGCPVKEGEKWGGTLWLRLPTP